MPGSWDQLGGLAADKRLGLGKATMMACAFFGDHMHQDVLRYDYFNRHEPHDILRDAQYVVEYDRDFDALIVLFTPGHGPVSADVTERVMGVIEAERQGQT